jgi:hypothetical protein
MKRTVKKASIMKPRKYTFDQLLNLYNPLCDAEPKQPNVRLWDLRFDFLDENEIQRQGILPSGHIGMIVH